MNSRLNFIKMATVFMVVVFIISCSPKKMLLNQFDGVFDSIEHVYLTDDDPQLVKESFPFNLKIIEILLDQDPDNRDLLLTALSSFTMYSFGFIMEDAEKISLSDYNAGNEIYNRANKLFSRGLKYGLHGIQLKYPDIDNLIEKRSSSSNPFEKDDIPYLYWLSAAIGGQVSSSQGNPQYLVNLPKTGWLLEKSLELDESWNNGALYSAMISYTMSRPDAIENREEVARKYFAKATKASDNNDLSMFVTLAESICVRNQNRTEFVEKLEYVLKFDIEKAEDLKLTNTIAQSKAKLLMERIDELFY